MLDPTPPTFGIEAVSVTKRFGGVTALDDVSLRVRAGSFHALLGENGAGKSTLVKCLMGYYRADAGEIILGDHQQIIDSPRTAHDLGLGMVYQHFTLVPSMTIAENFVLGKTQLPAVLNWREELARLERFFAAMPFRVPLDIPASALAAGEKQKAEITRQLYLGRRFLILDEPTSVLTPDEADEMLGLLKRMTRDGRLTVLMITHKLREVMAFADEVSVLRRGRYVGAAKSARSGLATAPSSCSAMPRSAASPIAAAFRACRRWRSPGCPPMTIAAIWRAATSTSWCAPARSSALPGCRATASASWSRRSTDSVRPPAVPCASTASPIMRGATRCTMRGSTACRRSRCATPASPA